MPITYYFREAALETSFILSVKSSDLLTSKYPKSLAIKTYPRRSRLTENL